jgi:hypothetical protein
MPLETPRSVPNFVVRAVEYARGHEVSDKFIGEFKWRDEAQTAGWDFYDRHLGEDHTFYIEYYINGIYQETFQVIPRKIKQE